MGRFRDFMEHAMVKLDEHNERSQAKAVAKLTPAERERYDMWVGRTEASLAGATEEELGDPRLTTAVLLGPAGEAMHGVVKRPKYDRPIEDAAAWTARQQAERAARDAARAPYLAPDRRPVRLHRVTADGDRQLETVCEVLASSGVAARPDLVYGVYRVPDLIDAGRLGGERSGVVEWDIVHAAETVLPPAPPPATLFLDARKVLVARRPGERSPLDEDLAADVLARAGIEPAQTIGVARAVSIRKWGGGPDDGGSSGIGATVHGVHVLVGGGPTARAGLAAAAPTGPRPLAEGPAPGLCIDVLQWDAIAQAVHPVRQRRAYLPSPFPYLPLTPQELLQAYLEIVGLSPADTFSAQVTYDRPFNLMGRTSLRWGVQRTGGGPALPCADGVDRQRMAGGHHIVVAYRDRPAYVEGRARFDAYAETELQARLRRGLALRAPVPKPDGRLARTVDAVGDVIEFFSMDPLTEDGFVPPRYCWPPSS